MWPAIISGLLRAAAPIAGRQALGVVGKEAAESVAKRSIGKTLGSAALGATRSAIFSAAINSSKSPESGQEKQYIS